MTVLALSKELRCILRVECVGGGYGRKAGPHTMNSSEESGLCRLQASSSRELAADAALHALLLSVPQPSQGLLHTFRELQRG